MPKHPFKMPPLEWIRAFDAAARCGSFTAAATETGLTQSAIITPLTFHGLLFWIIGILLIIIIRPKHQTRRGLLVTSICFIDVDDDISLRKL